MILPLARHMSFFIILEQLRSGPTSLQVKPHEPDWPDYVNWSFGPLRFAVPLQCFSRAVFLGQVMGTKYIIIYIYIDYKDIWDGHGNQVCTFPMLKTVTSRKLSGEACIVLPLQQFHEDSTRGCHFDLSPDGGLALYPPGGGSFWRFRHDSPGVIKGGWLGNPS